MNPENLDKLHADPEFIKFKKDVKNVNDEQINQIKKNANEIIVSKDGDKKVLSKILNKYYIDLDGRKRSDINNHTEDEKIKKIVDSGVEEDKHLNKLKSDLDEANNKYGLGLSAEEITTLLSQPVCKHMDKQRAQTGGFTLDSIYYDENGTPRDQYGNPINEGFSPVVPAVIAATLLAAGVCVLGGPVGCAIVGGLFGANLLGAGVVAVVEIRRATSGEEEQTQKGGLHHAEDINKDFERYFKKGKKCMEEQHGEYINNVVLPNLKDGTLLGKTKAHNPNEDTLAGLMNRLKPPQGGKRRTRKAKKAKKRSTKKAKKSAKRKARKSRR